MSKAIFDVDKVTVNNDDDVEVDIFDVEDDEVDDDPANESPQVEIKEESKKNEQTPVTSRVQVFGEERIFFKTFV